MADKQKAEEWKNRGNAALKEEKYNEAVECYTKAIECDPTNHILYSNRSAAYIKLEDGEAALKDAEKAIELAPTWSRGWGRKGAALFLLERYKDAIDAYTEGLKLEPSNESYQQSIKECEARLLEQSQEAARLFSDMAEVFQGDVKAKCKAHPMLQHLAEDASFLAKAEEIARFPSKLVNHLQDKNVVLYLNTQLSAMRGGQFDSDMSQEKPKEAPKQEPKKEEKKREEKKEDKMEVELTDDQKKALELKEKANELYKKKKFDEALSLYTQAAELDPTNMVYLNNKAAVYFETGKYEDCIKECEAAIELGRQHRADLKLIARAMQRIGNAYSKQGNLDKAIEWYNKSLIEHRDPATLDLLRKCEREREEKAKREYINPELGAKAKEEGNEHFKNQRYPEAVKAYTEAIKRDPTNHVYYSNRAAAYMKLGEMKLAIKDCDEALKLEPKFVRALLRKGTAYLRMKDWLKAMEAFDSALKIEPNNEEAQRGLAEVNMALYQQEQNESDEEVLKRAMADPEVREILSDPVMKQILADMQADPRAAADHLRNPEVAKRILKLKAAGIIR